MSHVCTFFPHDLSGRIANRMNGEHSCQHAIFRAFDLTMSRVPGPMRAHVGAPQLGSNKADLHGMSAPLKLRPRDLCRKRPSWGLQEELCRAWMGGSKSVTHSTAATRKENMRTSFGAAVRCMSTSQTSQKKQPDEIACRQHPASCMVA